MLVKMFCQDETVSSYIAKASQVFTLALTLRDDDPAHRMKELVELRLTGQDKENWHGKCLGKYVQIAVDRVAKFNGVARFEGSIVKVEEPVKK
jgi:hypothetical protein